MRSRLAVVCALVLGAIVAASPSVDATPSAAVQRISGPTRIETAIEVSVDGYLADEAGAVVLARADGYADALAGGPLAVSVDGPVLLTATSGLDGRTAAEIDRVLPDGATVYLLGGEAALSATVEDAVVQRGYEAVRLGGRNRFETAVVVNRDGLGDPDTILFANGFTHVDPLLAAVAAPGVGGGVLLTADDRLHEDTASYVASLAPTRTWAIGAQAAAAVPSAEPVTGADAAELSVRTAIEFFPVPTGLTVASSADFPDALAGGAHAARAGWPLLFTGRDAVPTIVEAWTRDRADTLAHGVVYGGEAVVAESTLLDFVYAIRDLAKPPAPSDYYTTDGSPPAKTPECDGLVGLCWGETYESIVAKFGAEQTRYGYDSQFGPVIVRSWPLGPGTLVVDFDRFETATDIGVFFDAPTSLRVSVVPGLVIGDTTMGEVSDVLGTPDHYGEFSGEGITVFFQEYRVGPEGFLVLRFAHTANWGDEPATGSGLAARTVTSVEVSDDTL